MPIRLPKQSGRKRLSAENSLDIILITVNDTVVNAGQADDAAVDSATFASKLIVSRGYINFPAYAVGRVSYYTC